MADKAVSELIEAKQVSPGDLFVLEQDGTAKKLTGQTLENWLLQMAQGHGGIHDIKKASSNGLVDTYRITLADTTSYDFTVSNGNGILSVSYISSKGLVDTYEIRFKEGEPFRYTVTNGAKGDKGDNSYTHYKWSSQMPTDASHSMSDIPDEWQGCYSGNSANPPADWKQYKWFKIKGEKGNTGDPATLVESKVEYQAGTSGTIPPSGVWLTNVPSVPQGGYLWTRTTEKFNTGEPVVHYSASRFGIDGKGAVASVCGVSPTPDGDVALTAKDVGAVAFSTYTADLNTVWSAAPEGGYMQSAAVPGILEEDKPRYSADLSGLTLAQVKAAVDAFSEIYRLTTENGVITVYSSRELTTALRIHLEVFR